MAEQTPENTSSKTPLCELRHVSQEFALPSGGKLRVLEDINISVHRDEIVAILGPSGCGKSTVLRILAGILPPTAGTVYSRGNELHGICEKIAVVFQGFALLPWMTVRENIASVLVALGRTPAEIQQKVDEVLELTGLAGFDSAWPRELSGGMKQRVGIARALAVEPELLFMDEPFSQVDPLTGESLRGELLRIWGRPGMNPSSVFIVSHDVREVATLASRIVIMSARPGRIRAILDNPLPRPRDPRSPQYLQFVETIHELIRGHEMPDTAPGASPQRVEPLPEATVNEVTGLLEYLQLRGGRDDVFRIASETGREYGHVIQIVNAAEMLDFVDTPRRAVVLETAGVDFVRADAAGRARVWRSQILKLRIFEEMNQLMEQNAEHEVDAEIVLSTFVLNLPFENYETMFRRFIGWARYGNLFDYDERREVLVRPEAGI